MKTFIAGSLLVLITWTRAAHADGRPNEDALFSATPSTASTPTSANPVPPPSHAPNARDDVQELQPHLLQDAFASGAVSDNPLQIGGLYYQRFIVTQNSGSSPKHDPVSMPLQFDAFMDVRPSDRVRGYVQGRLLYDPTRDQYNNPTSGNRQGSLQSASTSGAPQSLPGGTTNQTPTNPQGVLDQAWIKFDIQRSVFVTAGKQHVKWGTGRFWNPTDFLSTQRRDPLLPYDLRLGNTMAKFSMPLPRDGSNLNGIILFDNPEPGSTLGQLGGAFRGETLIGPAEVGLEAVGRGNSPPVYGADISSPLGPFDVYSEASLLSESPTVHYKSTGVPLLTGTDVATLATVDKSRGPFVQVTAGANYSFAWQANRRATLGAEYFYNQVGYRDSTIYPVLIFQGAYQPFYTGEQYGAIYLSAEGPDALKHTSYTFSTLTNASDGSYISRLDFSWRLLTYLTLEAYMDGHYGHHGGEFNFELQTPTLTNAGVSVSPMAIPSTILDGGLGLRLSF